MWITDWSQIEDGKLYIVAAIVQSFEGELRLIVLPGQRVGVYVKMLKEKCYAALLCPEWDGKLERS